MDDSVSVFRKKRRQRRAARLVDVVESDQFEPGAIDEKGHAIQVAHPGEIGAALDERDELLPIGLGSLAVGDVHTDHARNRTVPLSSLIGWMVISAARSLPSAGK